MSEDNKADPITLEKINQWLDEAVKINAELTEISSQESDLKNQRGFLLSKIQGALNEVGLKNFRNSRGLVSIRKNWDCKAPKDPAKKKEFYGWLKDMGWFDEWISVNTKTLNSQYKKLYEEKAKEGELFEIPGVGAPSYRETCVLTRK